MLPYRIRDLEAEWLHGIWLIYYFYNGCDWIYALLCLWIHPVRLLLCSYCIFLSLQTWSQIQVEISEDKISSVENNHLRNSLKLYLNRIKSLGLLLEVCVLKQFQFPSAISQWISFILGVERVWKIKYWSGVGYLKKIKYGSSQVWVHVKLYQKTLASLAKWSIDTNVLEYVSPTTPNFP